MFVAICLGGTLWLLDVPDFLTPSWTPAAVASVLALVWPWVPFTIASLLSLLLIGLAYERGREAVGQALIALFIVGGMFGYAGEKFAALDHYALRWICWAIIGVHLANLIVRIVRRAGEKD